MILCEVIATWLPEGMYPCDENKVAIDHMTKALSFLEVRTKKRISRGVEGKQVV